MPDSIAEAPLNLLCRNWMVTLGCMAIIAVQPLTVFAESSAPTARPRVGLALSGGGARGFSHVGVLKALETLRIPVDCIAGTSAGSAVGAAYAVGLSPDEIERRLREGEWAGGIFRDQPPREDLPFRSKSRSGGDPISVTLGVGPGGIKSTSGIFAGQQIELFLHRMLGVSAELDSFDALPVPFRAVTTDLVTGERVVRQRGSLVQAVRASMAVPSAFAPVNLDDRRLVDGGLAQNLPVQTVREACADVVIAVNIGSPLLKGDELNNVFAVALQVVSILMERNVADSLATMTPRDVLIVPDLSGVSAIDFEGGIDGIPLGERATLAAARELGRLSLSEQDYLAWQQLRRERMLEPPPVHSVAVAPTRFVPHGFFALDERKPAGESKPGALNTAGLQKLIQRWNSSGDFTNISYTLRPDEQGHTLWISAAEKSWGPDYLQVGFSGQTDSHGNADFTVQAALRKTWSNAWGAEWLTVARFGRKRELESRWFQPLGTGSRWFVEPRIGLSATPLKVFVGDAAVGELRLERQEVELRTGWQNTAALAQLALVGARIESTQVLGLPGVPTRRSDVNGTRITLAYDQLDDLDFPREGEFARLDSFHALRTLGSDTRYRRGDAEGEIARSAGSHTLRLRGRWSRVDSRGDRVVDFISTGGFMSLSGYQQGQFLGRELRLLSVGYAHRLASLPPPFGTGLYAGVALETAYIGQPLNLNVASIRRHGAVAYIGASTALGPVYLGLGMGQGGKRSVYLLLGRP